MVQVGFTEIGTLLPKITGIELPKNYFAKQINKIEKTLHT
jgi:hypothetical protein